MDNNVAQPNNSILDAPIAPENPTGAGQVIKKKSKAGLIIGIIIGVLVIAGGATAAVFIINNNKRISWHKDVAAELVDKISNGKSEKSVFFKADLEKLGDLINKSPYDPYSAGSYIAKYNDKIYLCLDNGRNKITGEKDNIQVAGMNGDEACHYDFQSDEREEYIYNYITQKYGFIVDKKQTKKEKDTYIISTDKGTIYADLSYSHNEIRISDDHETLTTDYEDVNNLFDIVNQRSLKYVGASKFSASTQIHDIEIANNTKNNLLMVQSSFRLSEAEEYLKSLSEYLKGKPVKNGIVGVVRYREQGTYGQSDYKIVSDYIIGLYITNGEHQIKTIDKNETYAEE